MACTPHGMHAVAALVPWCWWQGPCAVRHGHGLVGLAGVVWMAWPGRARGPWACTWPPHAGRARALGLLCVLAARAGQGLCALAARAGQGLGVLAARALHGLCALAARALGRA